MYRGPPGFDCAPPPIHNPVSPVFYPATLGLVREGSGLPMWTAGFTVRRCPPARTRRLDTHSYLYTCPYRVRFNALPLAYGAWATLLSSAPHFTWGTRVAAVIAHPRTPIPAQL